MKGLAIAASLLGLAMALGTEPFGVDLEGHPVAQLAPPGARAVVLFFTASDCPISNRYIPEIQRLAREYSSRGVHFWFVYPNPGDSAQIIRAHQQQYAIAANAVLDNRQALVRMAHVTITPEAAVFIPEGAKLREVYRGRIDDRYIAFGQERPQATEHDLEDAVRAVLANQSIPQPSGPPIGCSIVPLHP